MTVQFSNGLAAFAAALTWGATDVAVAQSPRQFTGIAAYYSTDYSGRTARGDTYDPTKFTAAHRSLPFGTRLRITDPRSQRMTAAPSRKDACSTCRWPLQKPCI